MRSAKFFLPSLGVTVAASLAAAPLKADLPELVSPLNPPAAMIGVPYDVPLMLYSNQPPCRVRFITVDMFGNAFDAPPAGIIVEQFPAASGNWRVTGTPVSLNAPGIYNLCLWIRDASNPSPNMNISVDTFAYWDLELREPIVCPAPRITAVEGSPYNVSATSSFTITGGGIAPYVFSAPAGLPPGMSLTSNGAITGTPAPGSSANSPYIIDVAFHDSSPELFGLTVYNVEIEVLPPVMLATTSLAPAEEGVAYPATQLQITGGTGPYTFGNTSGLPMGMNIDSDGMLSGTPSCAAVENGPSYTVSFDVTDSTSPPVTVPCTITLDVLGPSLAIDTATLADAYEGEPYSVLLAASGMSAAITWNVEGLPAGLNAGRIGGMWQIIGTPAVGSAGGYAVTLTLEESDGFSSHELSVPLPLNVVEPANATGLRVLTSYLPDAREGEAYTRQTIRASGGSGQYAFTISGLAPGMTDGPGTSGTHWIGGTPEAAGQYVVIIAVEDSIMGDRTSKALALVVSPAAAETGDVAVIHDGANVDLVGGAGCAMGQSRATYVWLLGLAVLAGVFALRRRSVFGT